MHFKIVKSYVMKKATLTLFVIVMGVSHFIAAQNDPQPFTRKILLEQFTTAQCGYCPAGADRLATATSGLTNLIWIRYHAGFGTDALTNGIAEAMTRFYGGSTYAPAMMVDRTRFDASNPGPVMNVGLVSSIRGHLSEAKEVKTYCKVQTPEVVYNPASHALDGTVKVRFSDAVYGPNTRLQILLIEDSIFMRQSDYDVGSYVDYWHFGAVRDTLTPLWGTPLTVEDNSFTYTFSYTLPSEYVYKNCKIVAIVYNYDPSNINNCKVLNAAMSDYLDKAVGIGEISERVQMRLFPNPANGFVVLEADAPVSSVSVIDAMGRCLYSLPVGGEQQVRLDLSHLSAGINMVRLQTTHGLATRQLILR